MTLDVGRRTKIWHLCRMLEAQLQMATEKAQMDVAMQKAEMERKVSMLVEKLRSQRFGLEVAKESLSGMSMEFSEVHTIVDEISESMAFSDCGRSQSLCDTGEASSRCSRRSAAGTVENSEGDTTKLQSAYMRIRKLEAELVVSQERSDRILGLENEMEMYTSMQDLKIQEMQCQIRDLHTKLVAERQRNEELVSTVSSIVIERVDQNSGSSSLNVPSQSGNIPQALGYADATRNAAEFVREAASERDKDVETPVRLHPEYNRGYSPYNPVEGHVDSGADGEQYEVNQQGLTGRRSVSDLASKFEYRPASAVGFGSQPLPLGHSSAHVEREITNSPRPRILQSPLKTGGPSAPKPLIQKALSLYDSMGKQSSGASRNANSVELHSSGRSQSSPARPSVLSTVKRPSNDTDPRSACDVDPHRDWSSNLKPTPSVAGDATASSTLDILLAEFNGQQEESNPKSSTPHLVPRVLPVLSSDMGVSPLQRQLLHNGM